MTSMRSNATVPTPIHSGSTSRGSGQERRGQRHGDPTVQDGEHDVRDDQYGSPDGCSQMYADRRQPAGRSADRGPGDTQRHGDCQQRQRHQSRDTNQLPGHATACFQRPVVNVWSRETKRASIPCRVIHAGPRSPRITPAVAAAFASAAVAATAVTLHHGVCAG